MTDAMMSLRALAEKSADADVLREMIGFAARPDAADRLHRPARDTSDCRTASDRASLIGVQSGPLLRVARRP